ncbi:MAG: 3-deoxy-manno-octulosonate cytidylyltransferase [Spongiibacteraceae bacterium]|nr:3-deoxy-manno-octulosonate cytidylyltransferase [Spongiibacteraceae bacterium]
MSFSVIIPARYASTRLEGKPLLDIAGRPMIQHVYERATHSQAAQVIIATDDQRIADVAQGFGANVCMTSPDHESGTDRLEEVVSQLALPHDHIVVNVQGDEPLIPASVIDQVANNLAANSQAGIATLVEPIKQVETVFDPNAVKVVIDNSGRALYFSRAPIPWDREAWANTDSATLSAQSKVYRHIGIYAYRVAFLHQFVGWPVSFLESTEKLEQLRALENGVTIQASEAIETIPAGIDTQEDLEKVRALLK